jgi:AcrR family transcriptional regulator
MATARSQFQPRKQPRQRRSQQTRQRILDAAGHVFAKHGYAAGTTNRIAERADLSIGSLYQYFPNKDAILMELMTAHLDASIVATEKHFAAGLPDSLEDILRLFVRSAIDVHRDAPQLHRVLFEEAPRPADFVRKLHEYETAVVALAQGVLAAHPQVRVADTRIAARLVVAAIESLVHRLIATPTPVEPRALENELVAMLTSYLTATDGTPAGSTIAG